MLVDGTSVHHFHQFVRIGRAAYDCMKHLLIAFALYCGDVIAQTESASLHSGVQFVAVIGHVLVKIHDAAVEFAHVLHNRLRHETPLDEIFQQTFRYPLGILYITLASRQLLYEIWIHKLEFHRFT